MTLLPMSWLSCSVSMPIMSSICALRSRGQVVRVRVVKGKCLCPRKRCGSESRGFGVWDLKCLPSTHASACGASERSESSMVSTMLYALSMANRTSRASVACVLRGCDLGSAAE